MGRCGRENGEGVVVVVVVGVVGVREWIKSGIRRREDRDGKGNGRGME